MDTFTRPDPRRPQSIPAHVAEPAGSAPPDPEDSEADDGPDGYGSDDALSEAGTDHGEPAASSAERASKDMLTAQHWINQGCIGKALGVFSANPTGNPQDPGLLKALLDLTPYQELPSAACMADEPGEPAFALHRAVYRKFVKGLPTGRACGTFLTTYELIHATDAAGASDAWYNFAFAFGQGALVGFSTITLSMSG